MATCLHHHTGSLWTADFYAPRGSERVDEVRSQLVGGNGVGLMRSNKETRPPKRLEDDHCGSASEQQWWNIQHGGAN